MLRFTITTEGPNTERITLEQDVEQFVAKFIAHSRVILDHLYMDKINTWQGRSVVWRGLAPKALFTADEIAKAEREAFEYIGKVFKERTGALL